MAKDLSLDESEKLLNDLLDNMSQKLEEAGFKI
jgi:hypothetical protein